MIAPREVATGFRQITPADLPACAAVFHVSLSELLGRHGQPSLPRNDLGLTTLFGHLLASDAERAWLAESADGGVEGFAFAHQRGQSWFLSFLYLRPEAQARGLGRELLLRCFPHDPALAAGDGLGGASAFDGTLATCADSLQPVSNGLYASYGMVPRVPVFTMLGRPRPGVLPDLPAGVERIAFDELAGAGPDGHRQLVVDLVGGIDHELLGYDRPLDHRFWRGADRRGFAYRDRGDGTVLGYGYAQPSGRLGPVGLRDGDLLPAVLGDLMSTLQPAGDWQVFVAGIAERAMVGLLRAGLRYDGTPALYCASRTGVDLSRYIAASYALL